MNDEILIRLLPAITTIGLFILVFFAIRGIARSFKRFLFELIDHIKAPGKPDYTAEARRASENAAPKKDKHAAPPWEE